MYMKYHIFKISAFYSSGKIPTILHTWKIHIIYPDEFSLATPSNDVVVGKSQIRHIYGIAQTC